MFDGQYLYRGKSVARWDASLALQTESSGLTVTVTSSSPVLDKSEEDEQFACEMSAALQAMLPETVDPSEVLQEVKAFEGYWQSSYCGMLSYNLADPAIRGDDLIFQLRLHGPQ